LGSIFTRNITAEGWTAWKECARKTTEEEKVKIGDWRDVMKNVKQEEMEALSNMDSKSP